jgi:membrane protein insertase Oxa1/YidC/SpoIIIJ
VGRGVRGLVPDWRESVFYQWAHDSAFQGLGVSAVSHPPGRADGEMSISRTIMQVVVRGGRNSGIGRMDPDRILRAAPTASMLDLQCNADLSTSWVRLSTLRNFIFSGFTYITFYFKLHFINSIYLLCGTIFFTIIIYTIVVHLAPCPNEQLSLTHHRPV